MMTQGGALDRVRQSPTDRGRVELLALDHTAVSEGELDAAHGLVGSKRRTDDRQLTIMNARVIELLAGGKDHWSIAGDQLFVDLDLSASNVPPGTRLQIGSAIVEATAPPHRGCSKFAARFGRAALELVNSPEGVELNLRGIHAKVVQGGMIHVGDAVNKMPVNPVLVDRPLVAVRERLSDRAFYIGMSLASVVAVFIGFAPTYYLRAYFGAPALRPLLQLHGFLFTSWILLFALQTALVASHQVRLHRRIGFVGAWLAGLITIVGTTTAIVSGRRDYVADSLAASTFLAVPLTDMLIFAVLAAAAISYRQRPDTHKRLMMLATVGLLDAAIARWRLAFIQGSGVTFFVVTDSLVVAAVVYDLVTRRRVDPANVWGGLLLIGSQPLRLLISHTSAWLSFASLLLR